MSDSTPVLSSYDRLNRPNRGQTNRYLSDPIWWDSNSTRTGWDRLSHVIVKVVATASLAAEVKSPVILYLLLPKAWADRFVNQLQSSGRVRTGWIPRLEYTVQISTPVADVVTPVFPYRLNTLLDDAIRLTVGHNSRADPCLHPSTPLSKHSKVQKPQHIRTFISRTIDSHHCNNIAVVAYNVQRDFRHYRSSLPYSSPFSPYTGLQSLLPYSRKPKQLRS